MPLEIQTIYNAAFSNCIYKNRLDTYKNSSELENNDSCLKFTNSHLTNEVNAQKTCKAVMLFLSHLKEHEVFTYGYPKYKDTTYKDNGCKYLFYWLYQHVLENKQTIKDVLKLYKELYGIYIQHHDSENTFDKYINEMNERTSDKLVRLTNLYNQLDEFFTKNENEKKECTGNFIALYNNYVDECQNGYDYDFCDELKNFRKKYNSFIKNVIQCEEKYLLPPVERFDILAFGPWIRRLLGRNENILEYINEEENHSLNTYEIQDDNSNMPNYYIAYNSS